MEAHLTNAEIDEIDRKGYLLGVYNERKDEEDLKRLCAQARAANRYKLALDYAEQLLGWHADMDADENDTSPDDTTAHVNGLILKKIAALKEPQ